jgi:hypothetical protein
VVELQQKARIGTNFMIVESKGSQLSWAISPRALQSEAEGFVNGKPRRGGNLLQLVNKEGGLIAPLLWEGA